MKRTTYSLLLLIAALTGCEEKSHVQPLTADGATAGTSGGGGTVGGGHRDSGDRDSGDDPRDAGDDAALSGEFRLNECFDGDEVPLNNGVFMPADLLVTRAYAHWVGNCADPSLEIGLSDGSCDDGNNGHELIIQIDADAITDSLLFIPGGNEVVQENPTEPLRIRYVRSASRDLFPSGTWGTCPGVFGELTIESLDVGDGDFLRAQLTATLGACTSSTTSTTIPITAQFDLALGRSLSEACR